MSIYAERTIVALHRMCREMQRKNIELARISKCAVQMILSGVSYNSISTDLIDKILKSQNPDGGFVSNTDTIWNAKLLSFFSDFHESYVRAIQYLNSNRTQLGFGRSARDMGRIPVTGIAFYLHPNLCNESQLAWLEDLWNSEKNSLTYKAAYVLMAFKINNYSPKDPKLISNALDWLASQQEIDGGFAPWKNHPVGSNIYCTALSVLGLQSYKSPEIINTISRAYQYMIESQLPSGIWAYHEIEDGAAWGLRALTAVEES
ncbi:MAG: terpene cyclase/mutase family protein [Selenomonadaceae bacterium]|nr:terpene cyclase/mutase family protein [Selenomonadaceae bacterium]